MHVGKAAALVGAPVAFSPTAFVLDGTLNASPLLLPFLSLRAAANKSPSLIYSLVFVVSSLYGLKMTSYRNRLQMVTEAPFQGLPPGPNRYMPRPDRSLMRQKYRQSKTKSLPCNGRWNLTWQRVLQLKKSMPPAMDSRLVLVSHITAGLGVFFLIARLSDGYLRMSITRGIDDNIHIVFPSWCKCRLGQINGAGEYYHHQYHH